MVKGNERINKWEYITLKSFCTVKKPSTKQNLLRGRRYAPVIYPIRD